MAWGYGVAGREKESRSSRPAPDTEPDVAGGKLVSATANAASGHVHPQDAHLGLIPGASPLPDRSRTSRPSPRRRPPLVLKFAPESLSPSPKSGGLATAAPSSSPVQTSSEGRRCRGVESWLLSGRIIVAPGGGPTESLRYPNRQLLLGVLAQGKVKEFVVR